MPKTVVATWPFSRAGVGTAVAAIRRGDTLLDAVEAGIRVVELDPTVLSVGYGGLPNSCGMLELDAALMCGDGRLGAVAGLTGYKAAIPAARLVLQHSPHSLLCGGGATRFAERHGLVPVHCNDNKDVRRGIHNNTQQRSRDCAYDYVNRDCELYINKSYSTDPLLTPHARGRFREYLAVSTTGTTTTTATTSYIADRKDDDVNKPPHNEGMAHTDTVGMLACDGVGGVVAGCATSGTPFKTPGRVGDSPVFGAGLFAEQGVGAATATGDGDQMIRFCLSFLAVERLRVGDSPMQAACHVIDRMVASSSEAGDENVCHAAVVVVDACSGRVGCAATHDGFGVVAWTEKDEGEDESEMVTERGGRKGNYNEDCLNEEEEEKGFYTLRPKGRGSGQWEHKCV